VGPSKNILENYKSSPNKEYKTALRKFTFQRAVSLGITWFLKTSDIER